MRSRPEALTLALLLSALPIQAAPLGQAPTRAEISQAIEAVKADPNLTPAKTVRSLKWVKSADSEPSKPIEPQGGFQWLIDLVRWVAQSARVLVWVTMALLAGLLVVFVLRNVRSPSLGPSRKIFPTHVQDLDIRPESLPDNIGAAARALWDSGDHRAALSLLYRGLLSRLVHVHNIPIRDSSTEGDTLQLTVTRMSQDRRDYVTRLIGIWQHAVYGGRAPDTGAVHVLCDEFAPALDTV